jgi:hypothetical protein
VILWDLVGGVLVIICGVFSFFLFFIFIIKNIKERERSMDIFLDVSHALA